MPKSHLTGVSDNPPVVASALGEGGSGGSGTKQKARKNEVVTYLKHLRTLSVALGCAIAIDATPLPAAALPTLAASAPAGISLVATAAHSSLDRLLAEAESSNTLAIFRPWYYQAWPESTFRNIVPPTLSNRTVSPQVRIDSFAGLLEDVINEA
jgi:hypothetical protein